MSLFGPLACALLVVAQVSAPRSVLDRSPAEWPVAADGRWDGWDDVAEPPPDVRPHLERVLAAYQRGHLPATLAALFDLLEVAPDYPTGLHQAGAIYFRLRRYDDAIHAFERYLKIAPHRVADTRYLAHAYYSLGRYEDAKALYTRILAEHPDRVASRHGLGLSWMRLGEPAKALVELRRVLAQRPDHADAAAWIAQILFDEERTEEAFSAAEAARDLDPHAPKPWFLLSQILYELERDGEADAAKARFDRLDATAQSVRRAEATLLLDPAQPDRYREIAELHRGVGNVRAAGKALSRWLRVEPESVEARVAIVDLAVDVGSARQAAPVIAELTRRADGDPAAWNVLLRYWTAMGDADGVARARARLRDLR